MISVRTSLGLLEHLRTFVHDGTTVAETLFEGGRLSYPGRREIEYQLGYEEPYTLELEARTIEGLTRRANAAVHLLSRLATEDHRGHDETLDLLWDAHDSYRPEKPEGPALDRLVAALVAVQDLVDGGKMPPDDLLRSAAEDAASALLAEMHSIGLPASHMGLEEIFDGAPPACIGLDLVGLD